MEHATAIEWTHVPGYKGETWNPVTGCTRISPGCGHCYARTMARRLKAMGQPHYQADGDGPGFGVSTHADTLDQPLRWRKPRAVFVNSMSDLFHDEIPDEFIQRVFAVMALAPRHVFMVLTKRPERARELMGDLTFTRGSWSWMVEHFVGDWDQEFEVTWPLPNVWLGVSIENARFTWRADVLRQIPAAVRFISAEPLLGSLFPGSHTGTNRRHAAPVGQSRTSGSSGQGAHGPDVGRGSEEGSPAREEDPVVEVERRSRSSAPLDLTGIDWVIIGGESGPGARPFHLEHAREIIRAAAATCTCYPGMCPRECEPACPYCSSAEPHRPAVFVKQLGRDPIHDPIGLGEGRYGTPLRLRDRKGGDWDEWPTDLRIREFPRSAA